MTGVAITVFIIYLSVVLPVLAAPVAPVTLDPRTIPKYVNQLTGPPPVYVPEYVDPLTGAEYYTVTMTAFTQQVLPTGFGPTSVWGYGGLTTAGPLPLSNQPGPSFEAQRGVPIYVRYLNKIAEPHMFPVDPTLHWARSDPILGDYFIPMFMPIMPGDPPFPPYPPGFNGKQEYPVGSGKYYDAQSYVPLVPHLHGGEVQSTSDGHPEAWFTESGLQGSAYNTELTTWWEGTTISTSETVFYYPNAQPPTTLWYHDHGLGITRINVMSGLAGFYLLRDAADTTMLSTGNYEMPLVIQDRTFKITDPLTGRTDFWFPEVGLDPSVHPYWQPEFFGDTIMVNGKVWPNMNVEQALYRFRLLDGSNARFYTLWFQVKPGPLNPLLNPPPLTFYQIGTDGGYLSAPVPLTRLTIAPGERADIIVDFSMLFPGDSVIIRNSANAPFPSGASPDPKTVGQIMQFTVTGPLTDGNQPTTIPPTLPNTIPILNPPTLSRTLTLIEKMGMLGPTEIFLDGQRWAGNPIQPISEMPTVGSTEDWYVVNPTADTHPIHLHLVQFQLVSRQKFNVGKYLADWMLLNGVDPVTMTGLPLNQPTANVPSLIPYLKGKPVGPAPNEMGWKDTIQMNPGEITIIRIRFAPIDGTPNYPFDPTSGPGYVWHCHILDHEDNEMMRPYIVAP